MERQTGQGRENVSAEDVKFPLNESISAHDNINSLPIF